MCSFIEPSFTYNTEFISLYGAALRRCGKLSESRAYFESKLDHIQRDSSCLNNYANTLVDLGLFDDARKIFDDLLSLSPPNKSDILSNIARIESLQGLGPSVLDTNKSVSASTSPLTDPLLLAFSTSEKSNFTKKLSSDTIKSTDSTHLTSQNFASNIQSILDLLPQSASSFVDEEISLAKIILDMNPN